MLTRSYWWPNKNVDNIFCLRSSNLVAHHPLVHVDYVVGVRDLEARERDGDQDGGDISFITLMVKST